MTTGTRSGKGSCCSGTSPWPQRTRVSSRAQRSTCPTGSLGKTGPGCSGTSSGQTGQRRRPRRCRTSSAPGRTSSCSSRASSSPSSSSATTPSTSRSGHRRSAPRSPSPRSRKPPSDLTGFISFAVHGQGRHGTACLVFPPLYFRHRYIPQQQRDRLAWRTGGVTDIFS